MKHDEALADQLVIEAVSALMEEWRDGVTSLGIIDALVCEHLKNEAVLGEWRAFVKASRQADVLWNPDAYPVGYDADEAADVAYETKRDAA